MKPPLVLTSSSFSALSSFSFSSSSSSSFSIFGFRGRGRGRGRISLAASFRFLLSLAVLVLAGCVAGPRLDTPAADSDAPAATGAPMPRTLGTDAATRKTGELLAAVGANELDALKPMDHAAMGHGGGAQKLGMDHSQHGQPAAKPGGGHEGMDHSQMPGMKPAPPAAPAPDTAATAAEMKKTEEEMKRAAAELKAKSDAMKAKPGAPPKATPHVCPMHPEVKSDKPGTCPKCGMALEKKAAAQPTSPK